jgi:hypothetical protein
VGVRLLETLHAFDDSTSSMETFIYELESLVNGDSRLTKLIVRIGMNTRFAQLLRSVKRIANRGTRH